MWFNVTVFINQFYTKTKALRKKISIIELMTLISSIRLKAAKRFLLSKITVRKSLFWICTKNEPVECNKKKWIEEFACRVWNMNKINKHKRVKILSCGIYLWLMRDHFWNSFPFCHHWNAFEMLYLTLTIEIWFSLGGFHIL